MKKVKEGRNFQVKAVRGMTGWKVVKTDLGRKIVFIDRSFMSNSSAKEAKDTG